jgi:pilus assembly protein Flp/PilA
MEYQKYDSKLIYIQGDKIMFEFLRKTEKGQDLAEYALLIGLIALVVILAVTILGTNISEVFSTIAASVATWFS